jgi:uncharacterized protein (TIGR02246 family)
MSATAQQLSEQEVRLAIERLLEAWDAAADKKDATAIATTYTEDAMRVTPGGFQYGRAAIEKGPAEAFKVVSKIADKVEKVQVVGDVVLVTGSWSATQSKLETAPCKLGAFGEALMCPTEMPGRLALLSSTGRFRLNSPSTCGQSLPEIQIHPDTMNLDTMTLLGR